MVAAYVTLQWNKNPFEKKEFKIFKSKYFTTIECSKTLLDYQSRQVVDEKIKLMFCKPHSHHHGM
jgi:hypothetical protein